MNTVLADILRGGLIQALEIERIGEGHGFASSIYHCRLLGTGEERAVVVKLWDTDSAAGSREVPFYRMFGRSVGPRIPAYFHAALDAKNRRGVLVLEDLGAVIQGDCLEQLDLARASALAEELAALHATWWKHPDLEEARWLPFVTTLQRDSEWFATHRAPFLRRFGDRLDDVGRELFENVARVHARSNELLAEAESTLLHGDLHLDNVVFEGDTGRPVLLDWARAAKGALALDLVQLLVEIGRPSDREQLLAVYREALRRRGSIELDESRLSRRIGGALLRKFVSATCGVARWQPASERETEMIACGLRRILSAVAAWREHDPGIFDFPDATA